jgi:hypothetical protein
MAKISLGFIHVVIKAEYWIMLVLRQDEETDEAYLLNLNAPSLFKQGGRYRVLLYKKHSMPSGILCRTTKNRLVGG